MKLRDDIIIREVGEESITVVPSPQGAGYSSVITLNSSATEVVKAFIGLELNADLVATFLINHYSIDQLQAEKDAKALMALIASSGLVSPQN